MTQMAAGLMRQLAGDAVEVHSAGTQPGTLINPLSAESLIEIGIDGIERMRLVRDEIAARVRLLAEQLLTAPPKRPEEPVR